MPIKVIIDSNNNTTSLFSSSKKRYIILNTGSTTSIATQDTYGVVKGSDSIIIENGRVKIAPSVLEDSFEGAAIKEWVIDQGYATSSWISSQDYASKTHLNQVLEAYPTSADLNAILAPYAAKEWVLNKFSSVWDDMPYATSTSVGGIKAHDTFVNGIRINNGFLEVDPSYADGGGHTFEDSAGIALPARSVAKAGDGIEFEDDAVNETTNITVDDTVTRKAEIYNVGTLKRFDINGNDEDSGLTGESLNIYDISSGLVAALEDSDNWIDGNGDPVAGSVLFAEGVKGQRHYSDEFFYECINDYRWARTFTGRPVLDIYNNPNLTIADRANLEDEDNWTGKVYTGPAFTGVHAGTKHYDNNYMYEFVQANLPIRYSRV